VIERQAADPSERFVVEIGYTDVQAELVETTLNRAGGLRGNDDVGALMTLGEGTGQQRNLGKVTGIAPIRSSPISPSRISLSYC
jgi:hypothetical protein